MYVQHNIEMRSSDLCCSRKISSSTYSKCVVSLRYPSYNALAPYFHPWPVRLFSIFPHYFI